jgi:mono/diheme cytochrome c family protein
MVLAGQGGLHDAITSAQAVVGRDNRVRLWIGLLALVPVAAAIAAWLVLAPKTIDSETAAAVSMPADAAAGRIVFYAGGCDSCHASPGQPDALRLGGGMALKTQFGTFYPPNISPDENDGIGAWSAVDFANALLEGVSPSGTHLYPSFPYPSYRRMTPKDVRDLFAYLKTLPPVAGRPTPTSLAFPFNIRRGIGLWKFWYLRPIANSDFAGRSESWRLGRYLVEGPGHCAECHSARYFLGGIIETKRLAGGPLPDGEGKAPSLQATGLAYWSKADIVEALSSGITPIGDQLRRPMAAVVRDTAQLPVSYREAIAEYLKSGAQ